MSIKHNIFCKVLLGLLLLVATQAYSQNVAINNTGTAPNKDAILDLSANTNGGFLLPYMTAAQMNAISPVTNSLLVYASDINCLEDYYNGCSCWQPAFCPCTVAPSTPAAPTGSASALSPCKSSTYTYSVTAVSNASSYIWTLSSGGTFSNGSTTITGPSITQAVTWGSVVATYSITVQASNTCGTSAASPALAVTLTNAIPSTPATPGGTAPVCTGGSGTYTVTAVAGATSYTWTFTASAGSFTVPGGGVTASNSITVTAPGSIGTGSVTVKATNGCGNTSAASPTYTMSVIGTPATPASVTGTTPAAINTTYTYTVASVTNATSYTWTIPAGSGTFSNATNTITSASLTQAITWGSTASVYTLSVTATDACGTGTAQTLAVTTTACAGVISLDASSASGDGIATFNITTTKTNDLVIVSVNGLTGAFSGSLSISPPSGLTPTATLYASTNVAADAALAIYWFVAPAVGKYTITINTGAWINGANFAWALTGFCSTPSASNIINPASAYNNSGCGSSVSGLSNTLTEAAGSFAIGTFTNYWCNTQTNPTWSGLSSTSGANDADDAYGFAWQAIASAATPTITATQSGNEGYGVLYLIDIH